MIDKQLVNIHGYNTEEALEKYSSYYLYPIEKYLFNRYYKPGDKILDLGCGAGRTTVRLYENGFKVKGIDLSEKLINSAILRFPHIDFKLGDFSSLAIENESYDHVLISHNGIDYAYPIEKRNKTIMECFRVLRKNGTFIFSSHNIKSLYFSPYYFFNIKRFGWKIKNTLFAIKETHYIKDLGMYTFYGSPDYVIKQSERYGFKIIEQVGFRQSNNYLFNKYVSPYIHYVFTKD